MYIVPFMTTRIVELCSARCSDESRSGSEYPDSSKHVRSAGTNLFVMKASSCLPFSVGVGVGGTNE